MCTVVAQKGNLTWVAHLTENFSYESPLSGRVRQAISAAFEQGWGDPKKLSQASHRAQGLRESAIEEFAQYLSLSPSQIEVVGEPHLLHFLAIAGFLRDETHLYTSTIDVGKIRAVARAHPGPTSEMRVDQQGQIVKPENPQAKDLISLQAENGETGIRQDLDSWRLMPTQVALDATRTIPAPGLTTGFSVATFDAQSWNGPTGLGFLVINEGQSYRYPLAHIAPIRVPGSYSLPLLVGATIALTEYQQEQEQINELRNRLADHLATVPGLTLIGDKSAQSRYLSLIVEGISGEEVLRALLKIGICIDAGSACSPEDLAPSHVIAALGYPTTGHLRITIQPDMTLSGIENLTKQLREVLHALSN